MDIVSKTSAYLAKNIETLRLIKNMSQFQLAQNAGLPRSTLTNIESGTANPSLKNLIKISLALGVSIEELLSKPRKESQLIKSIDIPIEIRNKGLVKIFKLLPEKIKGIEIDKIELEANAIMSGHPHLEGTKEYITVIYGQIDVFVSGEKHSLSKGDVFAFLGNQPHSYKNVRLNKSVAISVVIPVPSFF
jgi:transcriptional regulator with XRE-family HTH domain